MTLFEEIVKAEKRIRKYIRKTPLEYSAYLSRIGEANVFLKLENQQITSSFKARGALNKVLSLTKKQREKGVTTASTGNHAIAIANALKVIGMKGTIYLPSNVAKTKVDALRYYTVDLQFYGSSCNEAEMYARKTANEKGLTYISPYNDSQVIGGQGTIGIELYKQLKDIDYVFIAIGGGGLVSGVASFLKVVKPNIKIVGCWAKNSPVMYECIKAGEIIPVNEKETISDGTAGGIEPGSITFNPTKALIDDYILVTEDEIKKAIKLILEKHHQVIEGSAGVAVASYLKQKEKYKGKDIVILICGGNISTEKLTHILCNEN
jgi:threonine dehydratase